MKPEPAKSSPLDLRTYWRSTRRFTALLLCIWFIVTFGVIFFARALSELSLFGWTFPYYMAAQGTLFIYVTIVGVYAWRMPKLDRRLKQGDVDDE
jgi:putative solute:sodium symporter small subunit